MEAQREEESPAKEAAAASVGEEADRQAREAASRVKADLATSRAETAGGSFPPPGLTALDHPEERHKECLQEGV